MKKLLISMLLCVAAINVVNSSETRQEALKADEQMVWICNSSTAYAYHSNRNCKGLGRCKSCIKHVTLTEAKELGKSKPCGYCYGKNSGN